MTVNIIFTNFTVIIKNLITFLLNQSIIFQSTFFNDLNKLNKLKPTKEETQKKKQTNVYDTASELYNDLLEIYLMNTMIYWMQKEVK